MNGVRGLHHAEARIKATVTRLKELGLLPLIGAITRGQWCAGLVEALARLHQHLCTVERVLVAQVHRLLVVIVMSTLLLLLHFGR